MSSYAKQIADLQATRKEKADRMKEIQAKATEQTRTLDTGEQEEFDTLKVELGTIDKNVGNLRDLETLEKEDLATARPVDDSEKRNATVSTARSFAQPKNTQKLEPGIGFARVARCKALAALHHESPMQIANSIYPGDERLIHTLTMKAAVPAANTGTPAWAGNLLTDGAAFDDFVEFVRPQTVVGRVEDLLRRIPFDVPVAIQTTGGSAAWVGEGAAKPVTQWTYDRTILRPLKVATIAVATQEMLMRASASVDLLIRDELARAVRERLDIDFIDPDKAATANSPASILNGVTQLTSSTATDAEGVRCDLEAIMGSFADANLTLAGSFWIMSERTAIALSLMQNPLGQTAFPGVNFGGGTLLGLPVFVSNYAGTDSEGSVVALVRGSDIYLGDEGGIQVSVSDQASVQMDNAPTNNGVTPTATSLVSFWQDNLIGWRVERYINWARRRPEAVAWMRVNWSACSGS